MTRDEISQNWDWLHANLMDTLKSFDSEDEITEFVCCKIQSIIANNVPDCQFSEGIFCFNYISKCPAKNFFLV